MVQICPNTPTPDKNPGWSDNILFVLLPIQMFGAWFIHYSQTMYIPRHCSTDILQSSRLINITTQAVEYVPGTILACITSRMSLHYTNAILLKVHSEHVKENPQSIDQAHVQSSSPNENKVAKHLCIVLNSYISVLPFPSFFVFFSFSNFFCGFLLLQVFWLLYFPKTKPLLILAQIPDISLSLDLLKLPFPPSVGEEILT
ncbi:hypothetical protein P154DRAFT_82940 [Amniculicola lignicola CBS 123094]|uniref:Uncharacterized protein n=1 Tax=Amniculicola lignicola CBS 123094 TaxID=1392246 RepID=A0A6A5VV29_9PLEO|nr:hypothetical protein P154DRAFT_82940 [Amniculicola lignicola CBS 123094]